MVRGTTRQVVVVKSPDPKLFDQAIFLVKDEVVTEGGITEEALLQEARQVCTDGTKRSALKHKLLWAGSGAGAMGLLWLVSLLL